MTRPIPLIMFSVVFAFSCQKENKAADSETPAAPPPVASASVTISSFTLHEDCPDADPPEAEASQEKGASAVEGDSIGGFGPCQQSSMQIAITGQGEASAELDIVEVRLVGPSGATLGTLNTRSASVWNDNRYSPWDQVVLPKTDMRASYKLSSPDWRSVEKTLGGSSYGPMFLIEADVKIGGSKSTVRSGTVAREPMDMIET